MAAPGEMGEQRSAHEARIDALEREGRFPELATELALLANGAQGADRAQLLARVGEVRLRLDDVTRALAAFSDSLDLDPTQPISRRWLEVMLSEPEHALAAAEVLEPVYEREFRTNPHAGTMLLAILELRGNRTPDADERIAIWVQLAAMFDHAALPPDRQREIAARMLRRVALEWPGGVAKWVERVVRVSDDGAWRVEALVGALNQPLGDPVSVQELALAAGEALDQAGRTAEALAAFERALSSDPSSPEAVARIDALSSRAGEAPDRRIARYAAAIERASEPERRGALRVALGALQQSLLGDREAAAATFELALADSPSLLRAHEALMALHAEAGDAEAVERDVTRALPYLDATTKRAASLRLADSLAARGRSEDALVHLRPLLADAGADDPVLDFIERLCEEARDLETLQRLHERKVELAQDRAGRARAYENLAEFLQEWLGDAPAAARTCKFAAASFLSSPEDPLEAQRLYERALSFLPEDSEAARRIVELAAKTGDWSKLVEAFGVLLGTLAEPGVAVDLLLGLEAKAVQGSALAEFTVLVDESLARLGDADVERAHLLLAAKARVLVLAARFDDAAKVYEGLIDVFGDERDVRAYVGLVESNPAADWRHAKRRWLFEWRTARAEDPIAVLVHWAAVEEQEFSDVPAAIGLLERAAEQDAARVEVFRELSRLRIGSGDVSGGLEALSKLRGLGTGAEALDVEVKMASLLIERLDRPVEALPLLDAALAQAKEHPIAQRLALALCRNPATQTKAVELVERVSAEEPPAEQKKALAALLDATEGAPDLRDARRRWFERLLALETEEGALGVMERAAAEFPREEAIWRAAEELAVKRGDPDAAVRAYERALEKATDVEIAEMLGRRLIAFADQHVDNPRVLTAALERLLGLVPGARWVFDRVKFSLTSEQRWQSLFPLYEQAVDNAADDADRAALLDEAAIAARDVAGDAERAIRYWERYFELRPSDARVDLALERLYERQKKTTELIQHLSKREGALEGVDLLRLRERVAGLWLELHDGRSALAVVESLPKQAAGSDSTLELLERVFALKLSEGSAAEAVEAQRKIAKKAAKLLKQRYAAAERPADVARVVAQELATTPEKKERVKLLQKLAELRRGLGDAEGEFESLGELLLLEPDVAEHRARLGELSEGLAARARLAELVVVAAESASAPELFPRLLGDAAEIYLSLDDPARACELYARVLDECPDPKEKLRAAQLLEKLLLSRGRSAERCAVLERTAELEPDLDGQRRALLEAARVALEELGDAQRSARAYRVLLEREPGDRGLHDGLVRSLRAAESHAELAEALSDRAALEPGSPRAHRDLADVARLLAEKLESPERAIETWRTVRSRFGGDPESFEALSELLQGRGDWNDLAALLGEEAEAARHPAPLFARLAEVHRTHTGDLGAALKAYVRAGDTVAGAELLSEHGELLLDDPALPLELSASLSESGRADLAERVLKKQIEHYGPRRQKQSATVHLRLAELLRASGRADEALAELVLSAERYPNSAEILSSLGEVAFDGGDLDRAEQSYRGLLLLLGQPGGVAPPLRRAEVYLRLSEIAARKSGAEAADDHVASAFEAALASEDEALALERALKQKGSQDLLERAITARLERTRDPGKVLTALMDLLDASAVFGEVDAGLADRAERVADRAAKDLEGEGAQAPAWRSLIDVYERLGKKDRSLAVLELLEARSTSDADRADRSFEIARRQLQAAEQREPALDRLWSVVRRDAAHEAGELLASLVAESGELDELLRLIDDQLGVADARGDAARADALRLRKANLLEKSGRPSEALDVYRALSKSEEHRKPALRKVVRLLEGLEPNGAALADALEPLLALEQGPEAATLALRLATLRREQGDAAGAERALERGFAADPTHPAIRDELLALFTARGAFEASASLLARAVELAPDDGALRLRLAEAHRASGALETALAALDAALAARAPELEVRRQRALSLEALGRHDDALSELEAAQALEPSVGEELLQAIQRTNVWADSERWALKAVDLSIERNQRRRAREILDHWAKRHSDSVPVLTRLGKLASLDRDQAAAVDAYRKLSRLERGAAQRSAVLTLARLCEAAGRPDEAVADVERVLAEGGEAAELRRELGKLYAQSGARAKYARVLLGEVAAAKPPQRAELLLQAAELLGAEQEWSEAFAAVEQALALEPDRVEAITLRARVLAGGGRGDEAVQYLHAYLQPESRKRSKPLARVFRQLANLHLSRDELMEALEPLGHAYQLDKSDTESAYVLGLLAYDLDQFDMAANMLRVFTAVKDTAHDAERARQLSRAYTLLACIEHAKGQRTVARRMASRAVEADAENAAARRLLSELSAS